MPLLFMPPNSIRSFRLSFHVVRPSWHAYRTSVHSIQNRTTAFSGHYQVSVQSHHALTVRCSTATRMGKKRYLSEE